MGIISNNLIIMASLIDLIDGKTELSVSSIAKFQLAFAIPATIGCLARSSYMNSHEGSPPPKKFSFPTRIKFIDHWMLFWPFLAILVNFIMIVGSTYGVKYSDNDL